MKLSVAKEDGQFKLSAEIFTTNLAGSKSKEIFQAETGLTSRTLVDTKGKEPRDRIE